VARVRAGDERAFELLYDRYRARIGVYVQALLHDHARAEDVAQEAFLSAFRRLRETDQPIHFKPWIYQIAKNACIDELRRRSRGTREVSLEVGGDAWPPGRLLLSPALSPHRAVEEKQRIEDLRGAFRGLSESHHRILVLRELEGLSYNQIGDRLGLTRQVVESTLFRARRRLSEEFADLESGRRCGRVQQWIGDAQGGAAAALSARERRQFARHLGHCRGCRVALHRAGIDPAALGAAPARPKSPAGERSAIGFGRVQIERDPPA